MKKIALILLVFGLCLIEVSAKGVVDKNQCSNKGKNFIFTGGECIEFYEASADRKGILNIIVHGTWKEGTNVLGRYSTFADDLAIQTDITTVAIALPGYSSSSTNRLKALSSGKYLASTKEYIEFLAHLVESLQKKYKASTINYIGHSAGAAMGATLMGYKTRLVTNMICVGGYYDIHKINNNKELISAVDYLDSIDKNANLLLIYGTKDKISKQEVTKEFYNLTKNYAFKSSLVEVKGAEHLDLDMTDTSVEKIVELLEEK